MKKVLVKGKKDLAQGTKSMTIIQRTEDDECRTCVRKSFDYHVSRTSKLEPVNKAPQIYIEKTIDSNKATEGFNFHVKGSFYMTHQRVILKVDYHHVLNIQIRWKTKNFSPKKSEILT